MLIKIKSPLDGKVFRLNPEFVASVDASGPVNSTEYPDGYYAIKILGSGGTSVVRFENQRERDEYLEALERRLETITILP